MPAMAGGDLTNLRRRPIAQYYKLYSYQPVQVWKGSINGAHDRGETELTVTDISGNLGDALGHSTIWVRTSIDTLKDYPSKVRMKTITDATHIVVAENAIAWAAGDLLYAVRLFEPWPRIPGFTEDGETHYKDTDTAWASDNAAQPPKASGGPAVIVPIPSGGTVDVIYADAASYDCPAGALIDGTGSFLWTSYGPGGTAVVGGGVATKTVTLRYNTPGYYYERLQVTDSNGITNVHYIPVIIDDGTYHIGYVDPRARHWDKYGWVLDTSLLTYDADLTGLYDAAPVFCVTQESDFVAASAFAVNRSSLAYAGWWMRDETKLDAYDREVSYRAASLAHALSAIPAFPTGFRKDATPADWYEFSDLSVDSVVHLLLHWHSTALFVAGYWPLGEWTDVLRPGENCRADDMLSQVDDVLKSRFANLRCDRQGQLRATRSEWHRSAAEEAATATVLTLTTADWQVAQYGPKPHRARVREVRASGVDPSDNPLLSGAPGPAPLDGGRPLEVDRLAPKTQAELNQWAGQELSVQNWSIPLLLRMSGEYDCVDPAYGEYVEGALSSHDSKLPDGPYSVQGVRFTDDPAEGTIFAEWELIPDPMNYGGYTGATRPIKEQPPKPPPKEPPPPPPPPIDEFGWPLKVYFCARGAGAGADKGGVWKTEDFTDPDTATQPTWTKLSVTGDWPADNYILSFGIDVSDPDEYVYAMTTTTPAIIRYSVTAGTWSTILSAATVIADYGAGATIADMMVDRVTGYLCVIVKIDDGANDYHVLYRSTDPAAGVPAWGKTASGTYWARGAGNLWVYNDQVTYVITHDNPGPNHYIYVSTAGGAWVKTQMMVSAHVRITHFRNRDTVDVYSTVSDGEKMNHWQIGDAGGSGPSLVCSAGTPASVWERGQALWKRRNPMVFMPDPSDTSTLRFVANYSAFEGYLLTTADKFQTYTNQGRLDIGTNPGPVNRVVSMMADAVSASDFDMILYGSHDPAAGNEHTIFAADGSTDITPVGKSGANPDTGVNSIIYTADGPAWRGIQAVDDA